jgi:hypothetical protein
MPFPTISDEAELVTDLPAYQPGLVAELNRMKCLFQLRTIAAVLGANPPHHKANETADRLNLALSGEGELVFHDSQLIAEAKQDHA